ncbi:MAG: hypothetical protein A3J93_05320 [Candidatus Magasanikbacteria bacterium RIFOXYC2_FULL_42_28]|uniref:Single-stranded DNA-binding protein n=1 Tax=Candidatus Magasanikbacteria bacterium RIFOXYC2_FULL_42_28 TaxID=1798704 RepID=A0A1F6NVB6_9BACT|nr:MAG: hypothetical protein A3J93_05320 [Candidatus Magasanikbacteria bacterium RIFOXYC2_FULL_42_28]
MDLNRVMIIGRLTRDPEIRNTTTGKAVASVSVATGRQWTGTDGQKQQDTEFHNVVLWGRLAEISGQYLKKAAQVYIEGRLKTRDWVGQDGVKKYRTEIIAESMIMLGGPRAGATGGPSYAPQSVAPMSEPLPDSGGVVEEEVKVEDIPF